MHAQARSKPAKSPADLAAFLEVLANAGINVESASGSNIEQGGEFAFGLEHDPGDNGPYENAVSVLEGAGYIVRVVDSETDPALHTDMIDNVPGKLLDAVRAAVDKNAGTGRVIKDIAVGSPDPVTGLIRVQIYSEDPLH